MKRKVRDQLIKFISSSYYKEASGGAKNNPVVYGTVTLFSTHSETWCRILLAAALLSFCGLSHANMTVYPMSVEVAGNAEASTLQVSSQSKDTEYVRTMVKQVTHPGTPQEKEIPVKNMEGLVVSPDKLALLAGNSRVVRIIALETPVKEKVYRVYFESVPSPDADNEQITQQARVGINLVWGVLVRVMPEKKEVKLSLNQDGRTLLNSGNTHLNITKVAACAKSCAWSLIDKNIYPDESFAIPLPPGGHEIQVEYKDSKNAPPRVVTLTASSLPSSPEQ